MNKKQIIKAAASGADKDKIKEMIKGLPPKQVYRIQAGKDSNLYQIMQSLNRPFIKYVDGAFEIEF